MRSSALIPVSMFVAGLAVIGAAVATGEGEVSLFLVFPVFSGTSGLFMLGVSLIVLSFMIGFVLMLRNQIEVAGFENTGYEEKQSGRIEKRSGGFLLIGPVPIIYGSDSKMASKMFLIAVATAVCMMLVVFLLLLR